MPDIFYSADEIIDKTLVTTKALPYYDGVPTAGYQPKQLGVFQAGVSAGQVYSWIDADPSQGRNTIWWVFYPGVYGHYYYMPHNTGDFDISALVEQGAQSEADKNNPATWYEKILSQVLPVVVIAVLGAAAVKGYFSKKN
jgi:hypothetical protein